MSEYIEIKASFAPQQLMNEIEAASINPICLYFKHNAPDDLHIYFDANLDAGEQTILSQVVSDHVVPSSIEVVNVTQVKENSITCGRYLKKGYKFDIPAAVQEHKNTISLPFNVDVLAIRAELSNAKLNDSLKIYIDPDANIGNVDKIGGYTSGTKVVNVDQSVVDSIDIGFIVKFGSDISEYWITDFDATAKTITIWRKDSTDDGLVTGISDNDIVKRTVPMIDGEYFSELMPIITGDAKIGGSGIPAGTNVDIVLDNSEAIAKTLVLNVASLYGKIKS